MGLAYGISSTPSPPDERFGRKDRTRTSQPHHTIPMQRLSKGRLLKRLVSTETVFSLLCLVVMLPLVALSAYIHPQDYDFSWAVFLRENGFRGTYALAYLTQGGRYVANFLALLTPIPLDPSRPPTCCCTGWRPAPSCSVS